MSTDQDVSNFMKNKNRKCGSYNLDWFQNRAFATLSKISDGVWDFSDSLLLYLPSGAKKYESVQQIDTPYFKLVTKPEEDYLAEIASDIVKELPSRFEYIDLGPGTEHKEQYIFDAAKNQTKKFVYRPVDISKHFLRLSTEYALNQGIETKPILSSFEELSYKLKKSNAPRFVSLGLTFTNYAPAVILNLLQAIMGKKGYGFIDAQIRDRIDMNALEKIYYDQLISGFFDSKIKLLGLDPLKDISSRETDDGIHVWCTLKNSNKKLISKGVTEGHKLLVFQSLRYTKEALEQEIATVFPSYILFDNDKMFVGALLKSL